MKKILLRTFLGLFVFFIAVLIWNQVDQPLDPEIEEILKQAKPNLQTPGSDKYFGLFSNEESWIADGKKWRDELDAVFLTQDFRKQSEAMKNLKLHRPDVEISKDCPQTPCKDEVLASKKTEIDDFLTKNSWLAKHYLSLISEPESLSPRVDDMSFIAPETMKMMALQKIFHLYLQVNPDHLSSKQLAEALHQEAWYLTRSLQSHSLVLLELSILEAELKRNLELTKNLLKKKILKSQDIPADYLKAFQQIEIEKILHNSAVGELRLTNWFTNVLKYPGILTIDEPASFLNKLFTKRNETLNIYWKNNQEILKAGCGTPSEPPICSQENPFYIKFPWWTYLNNPSGKTLLKVVTPTYIDRLKRIRTFTKELNEANFNFEN